MTVTELLRLLIVALDNDIIRPDAIVRVWDPETQSFCPVSDGVVQMHEVTLEAQKTGDGE